MNASRSWLRDQSSFIYRQEALGKTEANDNNTEPNEPSTWESGSGKPGWEAVTTQADLVTRPSPGPGHVARISTSRLVFLSNRLIAMIGSYRGSG